MSDVVLSPPTRPKERNGLTILIPTWNHRAYLPRALASALDAAHALGAAGFDAEVLVVDDASRDGSQKLLRALELQRAESSLRTVFLGRNRGLQRVRNLGLELARFAHVLFLDADNELYGENVPLFLTAIHETGASLVYGNVLLRKGGSISGMESKEILGTGILSANTVDAMSVVNAERILAVGGYDPDPRVGWEDWEMLLHLAAEDEPIVFVPALLGSYFVTPLSMVKESNERSERSLAYLRRVYAQSGTRSWDGARVGRAYHPAIGYLDG